MDREEIESRLTELRKSHPSVFVDADYEVVNDAETRDINVEQSSLEDAKKLEHHKD
jgi:hypothetical protein